MMTKTNDLKLNLPYFSLVALDGSKAKQISLMELLDAKENRSHTQTRLIKTFGCTLVCLTVNYVGDVKTNDVTKTIFNQGAKAIFDNYKVEYFSVNLLPTGEEGFFVINHDAVKVKEFFAKVEETHPLGRFMDVDVFDSFGKQITRESINKPSRKCLLCGRDARECYLLRAHTQIELKSFIDNAVMEFIKSKEN